MRIPATLRTKTQSPDSSVLAPVRSPFRSRTFYPSSIFHKSAIRQQARISVIRICTTSSWGWCRRTSCRQGHCWILFCIIIGRIYLRFIQKVSGIERNILEPTKQKYYFNEHNIIQTTHLPNLCSHSTIWAHERISDILLRRRCRKKLHNSVVVKSGLSMTFIWRRDRKKVAHRAFIWVWLRTLFLHHVETYCRRSERDSSMEFIYTSKIKRKYSTFNRFPFLLERTRITFDTIINMYIRPTHYQKWIHRVYEILIRFTTCLPSISISFIYLSSLHIPFFGTFYLKQSNYALHNKNADIECVRGNLFNYKRFLCNTVL